MKIKTLIYCLLITSLIILSGCGSNTKITGAAVSNIQRPSSDNTCTCGCSMSIDSCTCPTAQAMRNKGG